MKKLKVVVIDNYDSFTYNLVHILDELEVEVTIIRNNQFHIDDLEAYDKILISPGPGIPSEAGLTKKVIKTYAAKKPILGICLGHQSIGQSYGGSIVQCKEIMHGKIDMIEHSGHELFKGVNKNFKATRYHSLIVERETLPPNLKIIAETRNKIIMGIAHKNKNIFGLQFHPESIGTIVGKTILKNFLSIIKYEY